MQKGELFAYSWHVDVSEEDRMDIRIYGLSEKNETVCVIVGNFTPYVYLELPTNVDWDNSKAQLVLNKINDLLKQRKPVKSQLMFKRRLYYANVNKKFERKLYPYLFLGFVHPEDIRQLAYKIYKPWNIPGIGAFTLKMHEQNANPVLQLTSNRKIPTTGWISFTGKKVPTDQQITYCGSEYRVSWENLTEKQSNKVARPLLMSFDIEVNSSVPSSMPKPERPQDKVFQISCILSRQGSKVNTYQKILLTLGVPDMDVLGEDIEVLMYDTEADLLEGFTAVIQDKQPNIVMGYNIFGFDIPYMIERSKVLFSLSEFDQQSMVKFAHCPERKIEWSSSAYKNQSFHFLEVEGRIFIDLLPIVKRDYKMNSYSLKVVASHFLKDMTKDPLDAKAIFKCYRLGMAGGKKGEKALGIVGKYCCKDSELVLRLFETLTTWFALCEMSKVTNVQIFALFTQGQQLKVFSQAYRKCTNENIVVEKDAYILKDTDYYVGATVFPPKPGVYNKVVPFDFASLYPTTIISNNISWDTLVGDESIPDEKCNVMEWNDHSYCIAEGTLITIGEYSIPIEKLAEYRGPLLGYNFTEKGISKYNMDNFYYKGIKECIELTLEDGTNLVCTPDHKILIRGDKWIEASKISIGEDRVITGSTSPCLEFEPEENFIFENFSFQGEKFIKFLQILGYLITDGHMAKNRTIIFCGHEVDVQNIVADIELLSPLSSRIRKQERCWSVTIVGKLGELFRKINGVVIGGKKGKRKFPELVKNLNKASLRAFLRGLFGGDGHTSVWSVKARCFSSVSISWSSDTESELRDSFIELQTYLEKLDIKSTIKRSQKNTHLTILQKDIFKFKEQIGFCYCAHKSTRLEASYSYFKLRDNVWNQQKWLISSVRNLKNIMTIEKATKQSIEELHKNYPIYNQYYANPTRSQMIQLLRPRRKQEKPMFSGKYFPSGLEYAQTIGADKFFTTADKIDKHPTYAVPRGTTSIPCLYKKVISIKPAGKRRVYDLSVENSHTFLANGIVVHNCDHDPKVIRQKELNEIIKKSDANLKKLREKRDKCKGGKSLEKLEYKKQIEEQVKATKPFREERSQLMKSKAKHIICCKRRYRWLKEPKGVLPEILTNLLESRDATKKEMKVVKGQLEKMDENSDEYTDMAVYLDVLDQRQTALKLSANSGYGCMGVRKGLLPFMPGAMCTTYMGRKSIEKAAESIQKDWGGVLVYGDTDSNYVNFPQFETAKECWDYSEKVAKEVSKMFPPPMKLAFEEKIYWRFLILTKKRYMSLTCSKEGVISDKISKKGVLLQRRDNCEFVRKVYGAVVMAIFERKSLDDILYYIIEELNNLCGGYYPVKYFVITKSVGDTGELYPREGNDKNDKPCMKVGDYKIRLNFMLSEDQKKNEEQLEQKGAVNNTDYYLKCLPAQVQLAEKMRTRGQLVSAGSRLEYVVTTNGGLNAKQSEKIEDVDYFIRHRASLSLDYFYYMEQLINPLDQILDILYTESENSGYKFTKGFMLSQYNFRVKCREKVLQQLKSCFTPVLKFL